MKKSIKGGIIMEKTIDSLKIAKNIKRLRLLNFMTQEDMANILGYSERQVRRLETVGTYNLYIISLILLLLILFWYTL
jgi:transcriptional regulator with XRE-family HTH domain